MVITPLGKFMRHVPLTEQQALLIAFGARTERFLQHTIIIAVGISLPSLYVSMNRMLTDSNKCSECYGGMSFLHDHSRNETPGRWLNQKEFWRKACMRNCPVKAIEEV